MMSTPTSSRLPAVTVEDARRAYHHGNLRAALLEAAERALAEGGVQELSLRGLARDIGVSHAAPRRHFPDRQALLDALAESGFERLGAGMAAAIEGAGGDFAARLTGLATAYVRFAAHHAELLTLMFSAKPHLKDAADRAFAPALALIVEGQAAGDLEPGAPDAVGTAILATMQGLAGLHAAGMLGDRELDGVVAETIGVLLTGLRPRQ